MKKIDKVYYTLKEIEEKNESGVSAVDICDFLNDDRPNISRLLNRLHKENRVTKYGTKPVYYNTLDFSKDKQNNINNYISFDVLYGIDSFLKDPVDRAKALLQYPPSGLNTLLIGERGVGKTSFAEAMYRYAREYGTFDEKSDYIHINCLEYQNHVENLIKFLKPVENISGKLKNKSDRFIYLSELESLDSASQNKILNEIFLEDMLESKLNKTRIVIGLRDLSGEMIDLYKKYLQHSIILPSLDKWSLQERLNLISENFKIEANRINLPIFIEKKVLQSILLYETQGNITQVETDIQWAVANAYLDYKSLDNDYVFIKYEHLAKHVAIGLFKLEENLLEINTLLASKSDIIKYLPSEGFGNSDINSFIESVNQQLSTNKNIDKNLTNLEIRKILSEELSEYIKDFELKKGYSNDKKESDILKNIIKKLEKDKELSKFTKGPLRSKIVKFLESLIYRATHGLTITYPKKKFIFNNYVELNDLSNRFIKLIELELGMELCDDELALSYLLFMDNEFTSNDSSVKIVVICHGSGIAKGMASYINKRFGVDIVFGMDLEDYDNFEILYDSLKHQIDVLDEGKGVLLLVDMGQLVTLESLLSDEVESEIRVLSDVTLSILLNATEMAEEGYKLKTIYNKCKSV